MALSKACQPGAGALAGETPLPHVAAALAQRKAIRILAMGAAPGRLAGAGRLHRLIEGMLENAIKGTDVIMINRGVSGELAANAATRMKNEVALEEPDLVLWQVGTNDALAYVGADEFAATVTDQIDWLKAHKVDVVLVGLQFAPQMVRTRTTSRSARRCARWRRPRPSLWCASTRPCRSSSRPRAKAPAPGRRIRAQRGRL